MKNSLELLIVEHLRQHGVVPLVWLRDHLHPGHAESTLAAILQLEEKGHVEMDRSGQEPTARLTTAGTVASMASAR